MFLIVSVKEIVFGRGTLPQAPIFMEKQVFGVGTLPQAPFICEIARFGFQEPSQNIFQGHNF